jgi:hypothetical protein
MCPATPGCQEMYERGIAGMRENRGLRCRGGGKPDDILRLPEWKRTNRTAVNPSCEHTRKKPTIEPSISAAKRPPENCGVKSRRLKRHAGFSTRNLCQSEPHGNTRRAVHPRSFAWGNCGHLNNWQL